MVPSFKLAEAGEGFLADVVVACNAEKLHMKKEIIMLNRIGRVTDSAVMIVRIIRAVYKIALHTLFAQTWWWFVAVALKIAAFVILLATIREFKMTLEVVLIAFVLLDIWVFTETGEFDSHALIRYFRVHGPLILVLLPIVLTFAIIH